LVTASPSEAKLVKEACFADKVPFVSEQNYRTVVLTVEIVPPDERDKFRALSRPETYHRVRRGCYTGEMTAEEYGRALMKLHRKRRRCVTRPRLPRLCNGR